MSVSLKKLLLGEQGLVVIFALAFIVVAAFVPNFLTERNMLGLLQSVVTIGISSLLVTPDNYGYMGPIKAALESAARFLAKSFSADTEIRFNVVGSGPLKTSASAGIPGYAESYLYAEKLTFRKRSLATQEVADVALFLLSERSSGVNGTTLVVDAGLGSNYFDKEIIRLAMRIER